MDLPRQDPVPWAPLPKPVKESRVAVVTTAGVHLADDTPFDLDRERREPMWGDPSYRVLPHSVVSEDVAFSHLHYDSSDAKEDLDVVLPVPLFRRFQEEGIVGEVAPRHFSFMGFQLDTTELLDVHLPEVISQLRKDAVDAVVLTPA
jgi:glycine/betaine/sarcosine/D-proline reductase family selenoprotein B